MLVINIMKHAAFSREQQRSRQIFKFKNQIFMFNYVFSEPAESHGAHDVAGLLEPVPPNVGQRQGTAWTVCHMAPLLL